MAGRPPARPARQAGEGGARIAHRPGARVLAASGQLTQRRAIGIGLLLAQGLMQLALAFDIQWHRSVGRDNFRIPPHLLLSVGVGALGGLCLAVVLRASWAFWRGRDAGAGQIVTVFGLFRAPVGAVLGGCGALITGVASLLDNLWWHSLYGPDFILWAPFHTMGLLGAILTATGIAYLWGDLARDDPRAAAIWGLRAALVALLGHLLVLAEPAAWQFPGLALGPLRVATAPLLLLALAPWPLLAAGRCGAGWGAVSVVALLLARDLVFEGIVPTIVREGAALTGAMIRPTVPPRFRAEIVAGDLLLLLAAWPLDWLRARGESADARRCLPGAPAGGAARPRRRAVRRDDGRSPEGSARMSRPILVVLVLALLASGAPVPRAGATVPLRAGPYALLVAIEAEPLRAGQPAPLRICPAPGGLPLDGASVTSAAIPAAGTAGAIGVPLALPADVDAPGCVAGQLLIGAAGAWALRVTVIGASGTGDAALPLAVEESAPVPVWLGWVIGLAPLVGFGWLAAWQARHWRRLGVMGGEEPG